MFKHSSAFSGLEHRIFTSSPSNPQKTFWDTYKLQGYGFDGKLYGILSDFLHNRIQRVVLPDVTYNGGLDPLVANDFNFI